MSGVFFDARYIRPSFHDGISRFSANLFAAMAEKIELTAIVCDEAQLEQLPPETKWVKLHAPTSALEPFSALKLNRYKPDLVFSPMQTIGSMGRKFKLVLTIHDLIYYRHPKPPANLAPLIRLGWRLFHLTFMPERLLLAGCDAVVAVSETTATELRAKRLTKKPIGVVYNAPEVHAVKGLQRKPAKSLVYMGTFMPYKNVETVIRGVALLTGFKLELLSRISPTREAELKSLADEVGAKVEFHRGVSDERYHELLGKATALVSASLDEGFGIPVVEAMAQGVPVVVSDIPIFREVAGDAGRFFEPRSPESFAAAIKATEANPVNSKALQTQAEKFNWAASATELLKLIEKI